MAAPTPTTRVDPTGTKLENGYRTLITFAADPDIDLFEIEITPMSLQGGDPIDTTTMHNDSVRTKAPQALVDFNGGTFTAAYASAVHTQLMALLNVETTITEKYPNGATLAYYGYLQSFEKDALANGTMPTGTATIVATNADPATSAEELPVYTAPPPPPP